MAQPPHMSSREDQPAQPYSLLSSDIVFYQKRSDKDHVQQLSMARSYGSYEAYLLRLMNLFDKKARKRTLVHNVLQVTIIFGAALSALLVSLSQVPKVFPAVLSGVVAVAAALANYYKFRDHAREYQLAATKVAFEFNQYTTERGPYKGKAKKEAQELLMDRTEEQLREFIRRSTDMESGGTSLSLTGGWT